MTAITAPERSPDQRMEALKRANVIRTGRAHLKRDIKAGRQEIVEVLLTPPDYAETMKVFDLLIACPKHGRVKVNKLLQICRISPSKTIGGLSPRQRTELVRWLPRGPVPASASSASTGGTDPSSQHMLELARANATRLERAALKHRVATGELAAADVVLNPPPEADGMTIADLLTAQHRWGHTRMRSFLAAIPMLEAKRLGSLTLRQRCVLAAQLRGEEIGPWWST